MTPTQFINRWRQVELSERSAAQQHFLDLCVLLGHPTPAEADPTGDSFTFEKGAGKLSGGEGWADVWKRGHFAWEYKGKHKDLKAAYLQLNQYREALENPPLLVVCDLDRIEVHTNFTGTRKALYVIPLSELSSPAHLEVLRCLFFEPQKLHPTERAERITEEGARRIAEVAEKMRVRGLEPHRVARFLDRVIFCLFAEDVGLLPSGLFSRVLLMSRRDPERFRQMAGELMAAMAKGGFFGADEIRHFNGHLFEDAEILPLEADELQAIREAAKLDWSNLEPSIFGTLFERGLDPARRSQLGAHYTSRHDIETLVEPVVMQPLRREWDQVRTAVTNLLTTGKKQPTGKEKPLTKAAERTARSEANAMLHSFLERLERVKVLDPACGSGNFLYVTLQKLKDLELEVMTFAGAQGFNGYFPLVGPWQLYGIEISPYAFELAQMTVWIGYLQWVHANGYGVQSDPVLRPMEGNFRLMDAILDLSDPEHPKEPEWPRVDYIVGNPPFLGDKKMRTELGDDYVEKLRTLYHSRIPGQSDLCCYWFEVGMSQVQRGAAKRVGLLATQGIRGGANREVLQRIKQHGDIFFAVSDRGWVLDGANVHVSMVAFDLGIETSHYLDGELVDAIHPNLTGNESDSSSAIQLRQNRGRSFIGTAKKAPLDIPDSVAQHFLLDPNPNGVVNSEVVRPWINGLDLTRRPSMMWIIDFPLGGSEASAANHVLPFEYARTHVYPLREQHRESVQERFWWRMARASPELRAAVAGLTRYLATPRVSKHHVVVWSDQVVVPDGQVVAFAFDGDYWLGLLQSRVHEVWALRQGTRLETRPRYTPTTCFETFPFPRPTQEQEAAIAAAAKELDGQRSAWLNPPEWTREEVLEFPGSVEGPWCRYVHRPDARGIGTVRYPRIVARDAESAALLAKRTLTNLYNENPTWLRNAHRTLDEAVFGAYGWSPDLTDDQLLEKLLALNLERAAEEAAWADGYRTHL